MIKLDIQKFADGKVVIDTKLNTSNFEKGLDKMKKESDRAGATIKNIVTGLGITKLIEKGFDTMVASIDSAISRVDTLNNFPKVMSNLGIGAEDAENSISKMSDKLAGLPTTLNDGASAVQRFTSKNGNVQKSTDIFLALNNAILAGGASSEIQSSALEQLSQSYAKGKPDMMEWRAAMTAMPAQLKQVATAMGYVNADELGEALRDGSVSMDDFMDTIIKLNTEGTDGFQSFEKQAKNSTGGIATSITVAKTQVVKGVADLINGLNDGLAEADLPSISEMITIIGKKAKEGIDLIAKRLPDIIKALKTLAPIISTVVGAILLYNASIKAMAALNMAKTIIGGVGAFLKLIPAIKSAKDVFTLFNMVLNLNPIGLIVTAIGLLVAAFIYLWNTSEDFRNFWIGIWEAIKNAVLAAWKWIKGAFNAVIDFVKNNWQGILLFLVNPFAGAFKLLYDNCEGFRNFVDNFIQSVIDFFVNLAVGIGNAIQSIITFFAELPGKIWKFLTDVIYKVINWGSNLVAKGKEAASNLFNAIVNKIKNLPSEMLNVGKNLVKGIWNGISNTTNWILDKIKGFGKSVLNGIKKIFGIKSPSRVMRDQVGKYLAQGIGVGMEDELDNVYRDMQHAIDLQNAKMRANIETGNIFNTISHSTPVQIEVNADVEMDSQKVGRLITPAVSKTLKTGGAS